MEVGRDKFGLSGDGEVDILNVKSDPMLIGSYRTQEGFLPAYHMNKENWIAVRKSSLYDNFNLPPQAKEQAERIFDGMLKLAEECKDQAEFETWLASSPLTQEYNSLFQRFSKYVKMPDGMPSQTDVIKGMATNTAKTSVATIVRNQARSWLINALPDEVSDWLIYRWYKVPVLGEVRSFFNLRDSFRRWFGLKKKK